MDSAHPRPLSQSPQGAGDKAWSAWVPAVPVSLPPATSPVIKLPYLSCLHHPHHHPQANSQL